MRTAKKAEDSVAMRTRFGLRLLQELVQESPVSNVLFSPTSVELALALAYNGAGGATRDAIAQVLDYRGMSVEAVNRDNMQLRQSLERPTPRVELCIANALWEDQRHTSPDVFVESLKQYYDAETFRLDLRAREAADTINAWAAKQTKDKITQLVSPDNLAAADVILTNAVYFHGKWQSPFDPADTTDGPFTRADGRMKQIPMMRSSGDYGYFETSGFQAASLPYGNGAFNFLVFLPARNSSLSAFLSGVNDESWSDWMKRFRKTDLATLQMPRFKVDYGAALSRPLSALGMGPALRAPTDFSPMGLPSDGFLSEVVHHALMEVDEAGTTAAAATAVLVAAGLAIAPRPSLIVDRPFFVAILHNPTGAVLFIGLICDPEAHQ